MKKLILSLTCIAIIMHYSCNKKEGVSNFADPKSKTTALESGSVSSFLPSTYETTPFAVIGFNNGDSCLIFNGSEPSMSLLQHYHGTSTYTYYSSSDSPGSLTKYSYYDASGLLIKKVDFAANGWPGDCDKLGKRVAGESFDDCCGRNFSNFCCDAVGCIALMMYPKSVCSGIALACALNGIATDNIDYITIVSSSTTYNCTY